MIWKDYITLNFSKPSEDEEMKEIRSKRVQSKKRLSDCYSRLETIEICTSNSKIQDALLISKYLYLDILNLVGAFEGKEEVKTSDPESVSIDSIQNPDLKNIISDLKSKLNFTSEEEDSVLQNEGVFSENLYKLEKLIFKKTENPIDNYYKRIKFQSIVFSILFLVLMGLGIKTYLEKRPLKEDTLSLDVSESKEKLPSGDSMITVPSHPEKNWETIKIEFPEEKTVEVFKIFPVHQNKARIQLKSLKAFKADGSLAYEKSFILQNLDLTEFTKTFQTDQIYPGKIAIGRAIEMETIGPNPVIHFFPENKVQSVKSVELELRMTKRANKFPD